MSVGIGFSRAVAVALAAGLLLAASTNVAAQPAYAAAFVSQVAPSFVETRTTAPVTITMQNTGTATWYRDSLDVYLATQEPQDNFYWCIQDNRYLGISGNRVVLPYDVAPNQQVTFTFDVKPLACRFAAASPLRFRMLSHLYGTFGDETPDPGVIVSTAAEYVSQQVPAVVPAGGSIHVTETFRNTTTATWLAADGYALGAAGPAGNTIWRTDSVPLPADVAPDASVTFSFEVVAPAIAGTYNFQWQMLGPGGSAFGEASPATAVQVVAAGPPNYEGLWWNDPAGSESGWGINLAHQANTIFLTWFTYDLNGKAWWLTMAAQPTAAGVYEGTLFTQTGPPFNAVPFAPKQVRSTAVGTGTLAFTDTATAKFTYTVNGVTQTKNIARQVFGPPPTCTFGLQPDLTLAYNYQDLWWAAPAGAEAGWGVNLTHQGDTIFATWFTYDLDGSPLWLSVTAFRTDAATYGGTLYRTRGPAFSAVPFLPAAIVATSVGTATFVFTDGNTGTFAYTVGDVTQTKSITREIFAAPGTVCQ